MDLSSKSKGVSVTLTLLLGPVGLLYSSVPAALIMAFITFVSLATVIIPVLCWLFSIFLGVHYVDKHNTNVKRLIALLENKKAAAGAA